MGERAADRSFWRPGDLSATLEPHRGWATSSRMALPCAFEFMFLSSQVVSTTRTSSCVLVLPASAKWARQSRSGFMRWARLCSSGTGPARRWKQADCQLQRRRAISPSAARWSYRCSSTPTAVNAVYHDPEGLLAAARDKLFIEMNTVQPETPQALAAAVTQAGGRFVECSGGRNHRAGKGGPIAWLSRG